MIESIAWDGDGLWCERVSVGAQSRRPTVTLMLLETGTVRELGVETQPWLRFGDRDDQRKPPSGPRFLLVEGKPAFELSNWCGSCAFLFQRLPGANQKASIPALADRLAAGLDRIDETVIDHFAQVLPADSYRPMLL